MILDEVSAIWATLHGRKICLLSVNWKKKNFLLGLSLSTHRDVSYPLPSVFFVLPDGNNTLKYEKFVNQHTPSTHSGKVSFFPTLTFIMISFGKHTFPLLPWKGVALSNVTSPIAFPRWLAAWSACTSLIPRWPTLNWNQTNHWSSVCWIYCLFADIEGVCKCPPFISAQQAKEFFKLHYIQWNVPYFSPIQIVVHLLLYEYKDQSIIKWMHMIFFLLSVESSTIPGLAHFRW